MSRARACDSSTPVSGTGKLYDDATTRLILDELINRKSTIQLPSQKCVADEESFP
ncbi:hypothetical protein COLO4_11695 [Corchorus olitorius]|uniref:Uncharacterized protein n=1 Tax=Corchorus olitorius TaxID=93759 RepID=A0A1R3K3I6_9ROSI|nr:hypothetical protein COLO4_11695 [Corchorus olitorius]